MVRLNNNIYIVTGFCNSCIYDLNNANLYKISKPFASFLNNIEEYTCVPDFIINSEIYKKLREEQIIICDDEELCTLIAIDKPQLKYGTIEITQKCNFKCIHCFEGERQCKELSFEEVKRIIDELIEVGIKNIHIFGGEPFIHPDICEILYYCEDKFQEIAITTNASIYNDEIEKCLLDIDPLVLASMHSDIEKEFDRVTNSKGMYDIVKGNIERMQSLKINCEIRKVMINGISSSREYEAFWSTHSGFPIMLGNANINQYSEEMLQKKVIRESNFAEKLDINRVLLNMKYQSCFSKNLYIDVNQDVYPCIMERRIRYGNMQNCKLNKVLNVEISQLTKDTINECKKCEYRYACDTCFVDTMSDDIQAKPWFCLYNPMNGKWSVDINSLNFKRKKNHHDEI